MCTTPYGRPSTQSAPKKLEVGTSIAGTPDALQSLLVVLCLQYTRAREIVSVGSGLAVGRPLFIFGKNICDSN